MSEMTAQAHEAAYQRLLAFAGKARNEVRNPNITANEAIYIANRLKALEGAVHAAAHEAHMRGRVYAAMTGNDGISTDEIYEIERRANRAILDAAREVE